MSTSPVRDPAATTDVAPRSGFDLVAVPLRRPGVVAFLRDWQVPARGARVAVVEQRPPARTRDDWLAGLDADATGAPDGGGVAGERDGTGAGDLVDRLLATDTAMAHVGTTTTDRLVPRHFLDDDTFLERNLGGWSPVWLGPMGVVADAGDDPLLAVAERLATYGDRIASERAPQALVRARLDGELPGGAARLRRGVRALRRLRARGAGHEDGAPEAVVGALVDAATGEGALAADLASILAHDELLEQLVRVELARRAALAEADGPRADRLARRQEEVAERWGIRLLLKGEYLMGRHRRSTVMLAEGAGVVVKQPAPEPRHAIDLAERSFDGQEENWPRAVDDGAMVTPRGAIADVVASGAVERLNSVFGRDVQFSAALGLSVEPFAEGPTLADLAVRRPDELTAARYDEILVHHLVCERLDVDNPDWHAANFMVTGGGLVHVDWGAARPVPSDARSPADARARLDQVRELAWSFQDEDLAARVVELHDRATADPDHLDRLRRAADDLVARA